VRVIVSTVAPDDVSTVISTLHRRGRYANSITIKHLGAAASLITLHDTATALVVDKKSAIVYINQVRLSACAVRATCYYSAAVLKPIRGTPYYQETHHQLTTSTIHTTLSLLNIMMTNIHTLLLTTAYAGGHTAH
jgi:hypothetical protein